MCRLRASTTAIALVLLVMVGCGRGDRADNIADNIGFDPTGPIPTLPECVDETTGEDAADPAGIEGLVLPDGAVLNSVSEVGPLTQVSASVAKTPVAVREHYEQRRDVQLLSSEDEVFEAELLLGVGDKHLHITALALCDEGSGIELIIAPAGQAQAVPDLAGPGTTSTPRQGELESPEG